MFNGLIDLPWWGYILVALGFTHATIVSVTIYLHRYEAHRAIALHPCVAFVFRAWLWLTTGMTTKTWTAIHRKHHAFVDREGDPHSPQTHGIRKVLLEGAELYRAAGKDRQMLERYGAGTPEDWLERHVFGPHDRIGVGLMLTANIVLFGPLGLTIWAVQMMWIPIFAAGVINGLGHFRGYRNFETPDTSTNLTPWGILIGGEELHNNHHAYASSARFSSRPFEVDIGWYYIRALSALGLAQVQKLAPVTRMDTAKPAIDGDTLTALITGRLHVMADYGKRVLHTVHREEVRKAESDTRKLLKPTRRLLSKEHSLMDEAQRSQLARSLELSAPLAVVYEFREQLHQIFVERSANHERLLHQLQEWCRRAEATGIAALEEFAASIRCYTLVTA